MQGSVEGVGGELGGMALGRREAADGGVDGVDVDQGSVEDGCPIDHLGDSGGCGPGRATSLCVEGDVLDAPLAHQERNA